MYNRYVPQPDGSFRRTRLPDRSRPVQQKQECPSEPAEASCAPEQVSCPPPPCAPIPEPRPGAPAKHPPKNGSCPGNRPAKKPEAPPCGPNHGSISGFFRQLIPKGMDTGDLLIILLLLLMAGDCPDDQNTALLTLVLYLFM